MLFFKASPIHIWIPITTLPCDVHSIQGDPRCDFHLSTVFDNSDYSTNCLFTCFWIIQLINCCQGVGNKPDWIIWTAASLFSSSVDALSKVLSSCWDCDTVKPSSGLFTFLAVFFLLLFSFTGVPSSLGPSLISSNSMLSSSLVFSCFVVHLLIL
jgi:hypothetical protein